MAAENVKIRCPAVPVWGARAFFVAPREHSRHTRGAPLFGHQPSPPSPPFCLAKLFTGDSRIVLRHAQVRLCSLLKSSRPATSGLKACQKRKTFRSAEALRHPKASFSTLESNPHQCVQFMRGAGVVEETEPTFLFHLA